MKRLFLALAILLLPAGALAQTQVGGIYRLTQPTLADGQQTALSLDASGRLMIVGAASAGGTAAGQNGTLSYCSVVTGNQAYTVGQVQPLNCTPTGRLKVGVSAATNIAPATLPTTTLESDLIGCIYRAAGATFSDQYTGAVPCDSVGNLAVSTRGGGNIATGQVAVGASPILIVAARVGRQRVTISVGAANACVVGPAGVSATTGFPLPVANQSITIDTAAAIYGNCPTASTTVSYVETY
jgi:hypothetical protein